MSISVHILSVRVARLSISVATLSNNVNCPLVKLDCLSM